MAMTSTFEILNSCNFTTGSCGWANNSWTLEEIDIPHGPHKGHTLSKKSFDRYVYLDGSKTNTGSVATLTSPILKDTCLDLCFVFWYFMYGKYVGTLEILIGDTLVWTRNGSQANEWRCGYVNYNQCKLKQIYVKATSTGEVQSNIALDDLFIFDNVQHCNDKLCYVTSYRSAPTTSTTSTKKTIERTSLFSKSTSLSTSTIRTHHQGFNVSYLLSLLVLPFIILAVGIGVVCKRKKEKPSDNIDNGLGQRNVAYESSCNVNKTTRFNDNVGRSLPQLPQDENPYASLNDEENQSKLEYDYVHPKYQERNMNKYSGENCKEEQNPYLSLIESSTLSVTLGGTTSAGDVSINGPNTQHDQNDTDNYITFINDDIFEEAENKLVDRGENDEETVECSRL